MTIEKQDMELIVSQITTYRDIFSKLQEIEKNLEATVTELKEKWGTLKGRLELTRSNNEILLTAMESKYGVTREELEKNIVESLHEQRN